MVSCIISTHPKLRHRRRHDILTDSSIDLMILCMLPNEVSSLFYIGPLTTLELASWLKQRGCSRCHSNRRLYTSRNTFTHLHTPVNCRISKRVTSTHFYSTPICLAWRKYFRHTKWVHYCNTIYRHLKIDLWIIYIHRKYKTKVSFGLIL